MLKLGTIAFGGPAVHVAMLREEAVRRRGWLTDEEFLDLFAAMSVLPGPTSTQLAIVVGRRRAGWRGLVAAGVCFIGPAMAIVLVLAVLYGRYGTTPTGAGLLYGIEPVVAAIVAVAVLELGKAAFRPRWLVVVSAFVLAGYFAGANVLLLLVGGGMVAVVATHVGRIDRLAAVPFPLTLGSLWAAHRPSRSPGLVDIAIEFAKLGSIVFGSGYVLLAFLRRDLVAGLDWLSLRQVLDAVAAGQVTPGPVFTTATFLGYLLGGVPGALVATAAIFVPSFVMVSLVAPHVHRLRASARATAALQGVTAAALGLMAGVTIDLVRTGADDVLRAAVAVAVLVAIVRWRPNPALLVAAGGLVGLAHALG